MLALAIANLLVIPFGTALGAYAFWVLLTNDAHRLFEPGPQESGTPACCRGPGHPVGAGWRTR